MGRNRLHYDTTRINRPTTPTTSTAFVLRVDAARASSPSSRTPRVMARLAPSPRPRAYRRVARASPRRAIVASSRAPPPRTCADAARDARATIRALRDAPDAPRRARVELPLPSIDVGADDVVYLGSHGQAADWSGGMAQRFRATRALLERALFDGYASEYLGLLHRDAEGVGLWTLRANAASDEAFAVVVTHVSDVTFEYFLKLLAGDYGETKSKIVVAVNAFWTGRGEEVGQPWEFGLKKAARACLTKDAWEKVYVCRRTRTAAGVEGTLARRWPGPFVLFCADGSAVVKEWVDEPSDREMAEALNAHAGVMDAVGFHRNAADASRDDDVVAR